MRNFRTLQISFRVFISVTLVIIFIAGARLHVFGLGIITADPYAILAYVASLMGLMALTLLFRIMRALESRAHDELEPYDPDRYRP